MNKQNNTSDVKEIDFTNREFLGDITEPQSEIIHLTPLTEGSETFRVKFIIFVADTETVIKNYEIQVPLVAVEEYYQLENGATEKNIQDYVNWQLHKRYQEDRDVLKMTERGLIFNEYGNRSFF